MSDVVPDVIAYNALISACENDAVNVVTDLHPDADRGAGVVGARCHVTPARRQGWAIGTGWVMHSGFGAAPKGPPLPQNSSPQGTSAAQDVINYSASTGAATYAIERQVVVLEAPACSALIGACDKNEGGSFDEAVRRTSGELHQVSLAPSACAKDKSKQLATKKRRSKMKRVVALSACGGYWQQSSVVDAVTYNVRQSACEQQHVVLELSTSSASNSACDQADVEQHELPSTSLLIMRWQWQEQSSSSSSSSYSGASNQQPR